jgi:hypothetical protein
MLELAAWLEKLDLNEDENYLGSGSEENEEASSDEPFVFSGKIIATPNFVN